MARTDIRGNVPERPQTTNVVRPKHLADAFIRVAKANHYMVGVTADYSSDELDAAEQILIDAQNAIPSQKGKLYSTLELALDLIDDIKTQMRDDIRDQLGG